MVLLFLLGLGTGKNITFRQTYPTICNPHQQILAPEQDFLTKWYYVIILGFSRKQSQ